MTVFPARNSGATSRRLHGASCGRPVCSPAGSGAQVETTGVSMKRRWRFWIIVLFLPTASMAEIYKWVDEHGKTHFSERKDQAGRAQRVELKSPGTGSILTDKSSAQYWQEQETRFRQRRAQKSAQPSAPIPSPAARPQSVTGGRSDGTDASRCALARDVLSGALAHPNGEPIDRYDLDVANNDVRAFCNK